MSRTPQRNLLGTALRRFGALALLIAVAVCVLTTWVVQRVSTTTYTADGYFNVPLASQPATGEIVLPGTPARPSDPYDAERFAKNYAAVLNQDQNLLAALSERTGISPADLAKDIAATNLPSSSTIRVTFTADTAQEVTSYFTAMRDLLQVNPPVTSNIPTGNLAVLNPPAEITAQPGLAPVAPWVGAAVGLLLGIGAAVLLERLLPQVRSAADLRELAAWPVLELPRDAGRERYESVVLRALGTSPPQRAAVVSVRGRADATRDTAALLRTAEDSLHRSGRLPREAQPTAWDALGPLPGDGRGERGVQDAGSTVVLVPHHAALKATTAAFQRLEDVGAQRVTVVLLGRGAGAGAAERAEGADRTAARTAEQATAPVVARER